jgi:hypothetical protein
MTIYSVYPERKRRAHRCFPALNCRGTALVVTTARFLRPGRFYGAEPYRAHLLFALSVAVRFHGTRITPYDSLFPFNFELLTINLFFLLRSLRLTIVTPRHRMHRNCRSGAETVR